MMQKNSVLWLVVVGLLVSLVSTSVEARNLEKSAPTPAEEITSPSDVPLPKPMTDSVLKNGPTLAAPIILGQSPAPAPIPLAPAIENAACQNRCVKYRHHCTLRKTCCRCDEDVKVTMSVKDPCCDCCVDITFCKPGCCTDCPKMCVHDGVFGRNVVEYTWCCGFRVKVVFDRCGDVLVHTYGR